ncbi:MAG: nucleotidyltransferase domain-containing protein [Nitrososphaerota archaeon]
MKNIFIREAFKREEAFKNLPKLLKEIKKILNEMDKESKIFLFGSVAKNEYVLISDIDVLILTKLKPNEVIAKLRKEGFDELFEFHVMDEKRFNFYKNFIKELKEII